MIFKNFSYNLIYLELFLRDVHKNINRAFKITFVRFLSVYCFLYFMVLSHLVRSYKRLAPHTYLRSGYWLFWNQCHAKYVHQWKLNKLLFQYQRWWKNNKKFSFMSMFKLSCDQYLHQKIKNFSKTNKIFLKNRIFREFFLNAKNCNNEFLKKINKKTPYEGVFSECVLE